MNSQSHSTEPVPDAHFVPSHYLIQVDDLAAAVEEARAAGFTVLWGSEPSKAHNALIFTSAGGFIELFTLPFTGLKGRLASAVVRAGAAVGSVAMQRAQGWKTKSGFCDFALETRAPLDEAIAELSRNAVSVSKARSFSRVESGGQTIRWQLCSPPSVELPFLMGPYTPEQSIESSDLQHDNGLRELVGLALATPEPVRYAESLAALLGTATVEPTADGARVDQGDFRFLVERGPEHRLLWLLGTGFSQEQIELGGLSLKRAE
ncbi:MAG: VOC family protein [Acidobacteriota bacterium]